MITSLSEVIFRTKRAIDAGTISETGLNPL